MIKNIWVCIQETFLLYYLPFETCHKKIKGQSAFYSFIFILGVITAMSIWYETSCPKGFLDDLITSETEEVRVSTNSPTSGMS